MIEGEWETFLTDGAKVRPVTIDHKSAAKWLWEANDMYPAWESDNANKHEKATILRLAIGVVDAALGITETTE